MIILGYFYTETCTSAPKYNLIHYISVKISSLCYIAVEMLVSTNAFLHNINATETAKCLTLVFIAKILK